MFFRSTKPEMGPGERRKNKTSPVVNLMPYFTASSFAQLELHLVLETTERRRHDTFSFSGLVAGLVLETWLLF